MFNFNQNFQKKIISFIPDTFAPSDVFSNANSIQIRRVLAELRDIIKPPAKPPVFFNKQMAKELSNSCKQLGNIFLNSQEGQRSILLIRELRSFLANLCAVNDLKSETFIKTIYTNLYHVAEHVDPQGQRPFRDLLYGAFFVAATESNVMAFRDTLLSLDLYSDTIRKAGLSGRLLSALIGIDVRQNIENIEDGRNPVENLNQLLIKFKDIANIEGQDASDFYNQSVPAFIGYLKDLTQRSKLDKDIIIETLHGNAEKNIFARSVLISKKFKAAFYTKLKIAPDIPRDISFNIDVALADFKSLIFPPVKSFVSNKISQELYDGSLQLESILNGFSGGTNEILLTRKLRLFFNDFSNMSGKEAMCVYMNLYNLAEHIDSNGQKPFRNLLYRAFFVAATESNVKGFRGTLLSLDLYSPNIRKVGQSGRLLSALIGIDARQNIKNIEGGINPVKNLNQLLVKFKDIANVEGQDDRAFYNESVPVFIGYLKDLTQRSKLNNNKIIEIFQSQASENIFARSVFINKEFQDTFCAHPIVVTGVHPNTNFDLNETLASIKFIISSPPKDFNLHGIDPTLCDKCQQLGNILSGSQGKASIILVVQKLRSFFDNFRDLSEQDFRKVYVNLYLLAEYTTPQASKPFNKLLYDAFFASSYQPDVKGFRLRTLVFDICKNKGRLLSTLIGKDVKQNLENIKNNIDPAKNLRGLIGTFKEIGSFEKKYHSSFYSEAPDAFIWYLKKLVEDKVLDVHVIINTLHAEKNSNQFAQIVMLSDDFVEFFINHKPPTSEASSHADLPFPQPSETTSIPKTIPKKRSYYDVFTPDYVNTKVLPKYKKLWWQKLVHIPTILAALAKDQEKALRNLKIRKPPVVYLVESKLTNKFSRALQIVAKKLSGVFSKNRNKFLLNKFSYRKVETDPYDISLLTERDNPPAISA